ncbi:hypothetical protein DFH27DRAFT_542297 [Peziza echinospora]|nr:hypothetical protein DFH27DRAFT_542297 [Peziza echinospora]
MRYLLAPNNSSPLKYHLRVPPLKCGILSHFRWDRFLISILVLLYHISCASPQHILMLILLVYYCIPEALHFFFSRLFNSFVLMVMRCNWTWWDIYAFSTLWYFSVILRGGGSCNCGMGVWGYGEGRRSREKGPRS